MECEKLIQHIRTEVRVIFVMNLLYTVSGIRQVINVNSIDLLCDLYIKHKLHTIVYMSQDSLGFVA